MTNSYEMAEVLELGTSKQEILGTKTQVLFEVDSILGMHWRTESDDIDEAE